MSLEDRAVLVIVLVFLASEIFMGPIRYVLGNTGLAFLIYAPKALLILVVLYMYGKTLITRKIHKVLLIGSLLIGLQLLVGLYYVGNPVQVLFGLWAIMPIVFGLSAYPNLVRGWTSTPTKLILLLWTAVIAGVLLEARIPFPWIGFSYTLGDAQVQASSLRWIFAVQRLGGFSRSSVMAAAVIIVLGLILFSRAAPAWRAFLFGAGAASLWLATSRISVVVWIVVVGLIVVHRHVAPAVKRLLPFCVACAGTVLPLLSGFIAYPINVPRAFWNSLFVRFTERWPAAFSLLLEHGNLLLGRGIGGIGAAQHYYETSLANPGDNTFVAVYITFGCLGALLLLYFSLRLGRMAGDPLPTTGIIYYLSLAILLHGWTSNILESPVEGMALGVCLGYALAARSAVRPDALLAAEPPPGECHEL